MRKLAETIPSYPIDKELEPLIDKKWEIEDQIEITTARLTQSQALTSFGAARSIHARSRVYHQCSAMFHMT